jgi:hypothetical protein
MDLRPYVENIQSQLLAATEAGPDEARELARRLMAPLEASIRLSLQDALVAAAEEITCELAPGSVELRLRGGELDFAVTPPPADPAGGGIDDDRNDRNIASSAHDPSRDGADADEGGMARINLRMPESLKARAERAANDEGLSVNSWLVRAAGAALERRDEGGRGVRNTSRGSQRFTGWAR